MAHDHHHHAPPTLSTAYTLGIVLNLAFVGVEAGAGFFMGSVSLVSDAAHNLADVGTLALSLLAFRLSFIRASNHFTYGYRKTSILAALMNSFILLATIGWIVWEAVNKVMHPAPVAGLGISLVAGVGIFVNGITAWFFFREKQDDVNVRGAYLHLLSDALVSAAIVVGGILIRFTGYYQIDPILSLAVALYILVATWKLLGESVRLSLDGVPVNIELQQIRNDAMSIAGVRGLHHVHIWALSSTENALTAHLVVDRGITNEQEHHIKHEFRHRLEHRNIRHVTLETERDDQDCQTEDCGPPSVEAPLEKQQQS